MIDMHNQLLLYGVQWIITIQIIWFLGRMAQAQVERQYAMKQARDLGEALHRALSTLKEDENRLGGQRKDRQTTCINTIVGAVDDVRDNLWRTLQHVVFTDITSLDDIVIALNEWNNLLAMVRDILEELKTRLHQVPLRQYEAYSVVQDFMVVLHKVITKCILCLGQLAPRAH